jgi:hypothetical protein
MAYSKKERFYDYPIENRQLKVHLIHSLVIFMVISYTRRHKGA